MAALSCYQPCRSHLAQPARVYDDEEARASATLSLRRRQFTERCHDARFTRYPDLIPEVKYTEVSVKRTREELAKHASQTLPLNRRLNVESGWSKVEEVRKKFEAAAAAPSYSRSFESPPRRRLADSLFASFKLPRKKDGMSTSRSLAPQPHQKRKSAVELLAESKAFYVKSETVLDRKQELPLRVSSGLSQAIAAGGCHLVSSGTLTNDGCCNNIYSTRGGTGTGGGTRRPTVPGESLQGTLRRLLDHGDSRENVYAPTYPTHKIYVDSRRLKDSYNEHSRTPHNSGTFSGTFSGTSSSGTSGSKAHRSDPERMNRPLSFGDARMFFPDSFVIPRQRPTKIVLKSAYSIPSSQSSPEALPPEAIEQLATISPPAQYAHSASRYTRSNSHSQASVREEDDCANINSHKSLPDLHTQIRSYQDHVAVGSTEISGSIGRSPRRRRHSTHQRTASCSSKGTRSNHSSQISSCEAFSEHPSPGDDNYPSYNSRCGSSFARDSGGSSGHYTQRSAPPLARRRDSGSSTQHDHSRCGESEWVVSAPPQFQDGAPPAPPAPPTPPAPRAPHAPHPRVGIHFQASAPPPQFQDEPPVYDYGDYDCTYKAKKYVNINRKDYITSKDYGRYHEPRTELISKQPQYQEIHMRTRIEDTQDYVNTTQICGPEEVTSPLGTFKRQRCLRYKQRRPKPILRSKSDISDRCPRGESRPPPIESSGVNTVVPATMVSSASSLAQQASTPEALQHFFSRLGLEPRQYEALRAPPPESPVFFSSASTVDSNQLIATDYTVQGPGVQKPAYRNTEPPSVVERNARIIKWLCQCRKTQLQHPQ